MKPYLVRPPAGRQWATVAQQCTAAQLEYYGIVGKRLFEWTPGFMARLQRGELLTLAAWDDADVLVGSMIAHVRTQAEPPTFYIYGMASAQRLSDKERLCVYYSLLLGGYPYCDGLRRGYGEVEASNGLILEAFEKIAQARQELIGTIPATEAVEKRAGTIAITIEPIDETYREGLLKCIEEL